MMGPSLEKYINLVGINHLSKNTIYMIFLEYLYNIKELHKKGFFHLDLKLDNITALYEPIIINTNKIKFTLIDF